MPFRKYLYREQEEGAQYRYFFTCAHVYIPQNCSPFVIYDPLWRMTQYLELGLELEQSFSIPLVQPSTQTLNISVVIMTFTKAPPPYNFERFHHEMWKISYSIWNFPSI